MADMTNVNFRMDKDLKEKAETLFGELGLNLTTAFTVFAKQAVREGRIPFELTIQTDPFYSEANMRHLRQQVAELEKGNYVVKTMAELEAMAADE